MRQYHQINLLTDFISKHLVLTDSLHFPTTIVHQLDASRSRPGCPMWQPVFDSALQHEGRIYISSLWSSACFHSAIIRSTSIHSKFKNPSPLQSTTPAAGHLSYNTKPTFQPQPQRRCPPPPPPPVPLPFSAPPQQSSPLASPSRKGSQAIPTPRRPTNSPIRASSPSHPP